MRTLRPSLRKVEPNRDDDHGHPEVLQTLLNRESRFVVKNSCDHGIVLEAKLPGDDQRAPADPRGASPTRLRRTNGHVTGSGCSVAALMVRRKRFRNAVIAFGTFGCLSSRNASSFAESTPSLALDPAPAGDPGVAVERAGVRGHWLPSVRIVGDYAVGPLTLSNVAQDFDRVVTRQTWLHALASLSWAYRVVVGVDVPVLLSESGEAPPESGATAPRPSQTTSLADLRLMARTKILGTPSDAQNTADLALSAWVWLPTAGVGYTGDGATRFRLSLVAEGTTQRAYWAVNAGVRTRPSEKLPGILPTRVGNSLAFGAAVGFFADKKRAIELGVELLADLPVANEARLLDPKATAAHAFVTGRYRLSTPPFEVGAAFGPGLGHGVGSDDFRVLAFLGVASQRPPPPPDEDKDGIPDKEDACVNLGGVRSSDPMLHGCPAAPQDGDGDGIPDRQDACPSVAGKATYVAATHGCPTAVDTDSDGVPDSVDACPREPGERPPSGNGCPGSGPQAARLADREIVLHQQVQFETGSAVLRPESDAVLGEIARILTEHPEIELIEVQGHTDEHGTPERNRLLGHDRAASVARWLESREVARSRLVAKGYGSDRPIADNTDDAGRQKNRRVEFRILIKKPTDVRNLSRDTPKGQP